MAVLAIGAAHAEIELGSGALLKSGHGCIVQGIELPIA
jgi:hypothetical protein